MRRPPNPGPPDGPGPGVTLPGSAEGPTGGLLSWATVREHWALAGVLGAYVLTLLVVPVLVPAAVNDDWIWTRSVEILLETGRLQVLDISAPFALVQILWGAPFAAVLDNVFGALRLATVAFVGVTAVGVYALCRELGVRPQGSALGTALYLFNPLTFSLSYTFLTDGYYTGLLVVATACYARGLRGDERAGAFLWAGSVAASLVYLQRATGVLVPAAVVVFLLVTGRVRADGRGVRDVARVAGVPAAVLVGFTVFGSVIAGSSTQDLFVQAFLDTSWQDGWLLLGRMSYVHLLYAGFFVLPLAAAVVPAAPQLLRRVSAGGWLLTAGALTVLIAGLVGFSRRLMPSVPQFVGPWGLGPVDILGGRPQVFGTGFAVGLTVACAVSVVAFVLALAGRAGRDRAPEAAAPAGLVAAVAVGQAAAATALSFLFTESFVSLDRYLLPLAPLVIALALWALHGVRVLLPVAWTAVALLAVVSVAGVRDHLLFQGGVWDLARHANAQGVDNTRLDAGYAWDGYHLYELSRADDIQPRTPDGPWWTDELFAPATDSTYVVAGEPLDDHHVVDARPYSSWLLGDDIPLYLLRREP